ncbi:MAG: isoleucine--tRNA ligase [Alphaproteobacteria bacterium]|nr:MAG: isoleucine--tRNA ligase [Rickettsiaceae bacterium 4572_127]
MKYKPTTSQPSFPLIETAIQKFWEENKTFEKSVKNREGAKSFVFWDGPPGANGEPHYGHISVSSMKDAVCRYQTMRGHQVKRNFGWDCHGLPVEIEVCKKNKLLDRQAILDYGIDNFNAVCEKSVHTYKSAWIKQLKRIGRWGDYENQYQTMDKNYMESVIAVIKKLHEKGLLYKAYKTMAYSWGAECPSSNVELEYKKRTDKAITVLAELENKPNTFLVLWTTTPWTLPSNMIVAVGKNIDYVEVEEDGKKYILAENLAERYFKNPLIINRYKGSDLEEMPYKPIFPYFKDMKKQGCFQIHCADFVTAKDGTGLVHIAPFGEDDYNLLVEKKIEVVCPVNAKAEFIAPIKDYLGLNVFDSNEPIIQDLKKRGILVKQETIVHNYPHCWRTGTPLIYKPIDSWFVNVQKIKKQIIANNQNVNWITKHIKNGRMGKWLENARDWSITRNRFWGTPMPVWESDNADFPRIDIFGSIAEIEKASGMKIKDLHRPEIDKIVYKNPADPTGKTMMRRVSFVMDCWFDAGSMPYASIHYPFENKDKFERHFPADFIIEADEQTRGWFYGLIVLSTALFNIPSYKNVMTNGMVMAGDGKKMSKSLKNYPDPDKLFQTIGADPFRWFILSSNLFNAETVAIDLHGEIVKKASRNALLPLWNAYHFFTLYANADGIKAEEISESSDILDTYILAKKQELEIKMTGLLDGYKFDKATEEISKFLEILNNWYIRRSRTRFWGTDVSKESEQIAFNTLYTVLVSVVKLMAPITPMLSEFIFQNLTGEESVHLTDWKKAENLSDQQLKLISSMDAVRAYCSAGKTVRENTKLRNRLPLQSATIVREDFKNLEQFSSLISEELNLKSVLFSSDLNSFAEPFLYIKTPEVGKRLGSALQKIIPASKKNQYEIKDKKLHIAGYILNENEFESRLEIKKGFTGKALADNTGVIVLDTEITDELYAEGLARDFIRVIQDERKRLDLDISDRIKISYNSESEKVLASMKKWDTYIKEQVLADEIKIEDSSREGIIDDIKIKFEVKK